MAFLFENFAAQSGMSSRGVAPAVFSYLTSDPVDTAAGSGYFNNIASLLRVGDVILVSVGSKTAVTAVGVLAVAGITEAGVVTTVKLAAGA